MDDLVQFLKARYGEAEKEQNSLDHWHARYCESLPDGDRPTFPCDCGVPQRVLADIAAKRQVLALHQQMEDAQEMLDFCATCDATGRYPEYPCTTLRLLALPYAGHPDYREQWRPEPS